MSLALTKVQHCRMLHNSLHLFVLSKKDLAMVQDDASCKNAHRHKGKLPNAGERPCSMT